jgi:hypothetical protein
VHPDHRGSLTIYIFFLKLNYRFFPIPLNFTGPKLERRNKNKKKKNIKVKIHFDNS